MDQGDCSDPPTCAGSVTGTMIGVEAVLAAGAEAVAGVGVEAGAGVGAGAAEFVAVLGTATDIDGLDVASDSLGGHDATSTAEATP